MKGVNSFNYARLQCGDVTEPLFENPLVREHTSLWKKNVA